MITILKGSPREYWQRIEALVRRNVDEIAGDIPVNVNLDLYDAAYKAGNLICLFAFIDNEIVGYSVAWITSDPHDETSIKAVSDIIYVEPSSRKTSAGIMLVSETEAEAKRNGADSMTWEARPETGFNKMLTIMNYEKSNTFKRAL